MSSIYEYISSILWFERTLIYLHFLSILLFTFLLISIFLISFPPEHILKKWFFTINYLLILDNFGFSGGRNGYIYIQEVGKQDIAVGILLSIAAIPCCINLKRKQYFR